MEYRDYYQILGVPRTATAAEIKKAFRKLAREHHPDRNPGDKAAERRFKDVNEAHAVLSDPAKRRQYDTLGANWEQYQRAGAGGADPFGPGGPFAGWSAGGPSGGGAPGGGPGGGNVRYEFHTTGTGDAGFSDFFRAFFSGMGRGGAAAGGRGAAAGTRARPRGGTAAGGASFEDILGQMGWEDTGSAGTGTPGTPGAAGARGRSAAATRTPAALEAPTDVTLEEAFHGTSRVVEIEGRRYEVSLPRGVDTGSRIRLSGKGPDGRDVVVVVRQRPHAVFTRRGADLERELPITLREALLGAEVPVTTLKGRILLTIPPGTQQGRTFRLAGQGMPRLKDGETGNLLVKVRVVLPTTLDDEARAAAARFLDLVHQPDPRQSS